MITTRHQHAGNTGGNITGPNTQSLPVLLIESAATARHTINKLLVAGGFRIALANGYADGLTKLQNFTKQQNIGAVVVGFSASYSHDEAELLNQLKQSELQDVPVLILCHEVKRELFEWVARREHTALLSWEDCNKSADCIQRLQKNKEKPPLPVEPSDGAVRILFVDDSRTAQLKFCRLLRKQGYKVDVAGNCAEAMIKAKHAQYDIAIIDYFMPHENGDVLCRRLREDPQTANITTAVITGTYLEDLIKDTLAAGAVECMFKNEANELFLARVAAMARTVRINQSIESEHTRLASILGSVGEGVYGVTQQGEITFMNPAARSMLGLNDNTQIIGRRAHDLFHYANERGKPNPLQQCALQHAYETGEELRDWQTHFWHFDERPLPVECTVRPLRAQNKLEGTVVAFRDIAERKRLEDELMWQANHDALTKLHNRRYFENYLENEVARIQRSNESSALLYIDLDRFKYINDTAGHTAGDQLLIEISKQLKTRLRDTDLLARLGGDEFAIIMRNTNTENIQGASEAFREVLEQYSFAYEGKQYQVNGSIGVALIDRDITSAGDVLANADIACHIAKSRGRNQTHIYQPENDEKVVMNLDLGWSERLQSALKQDSFQLLYQPIIPVRNLDTERLPVGDGEIWQEYEKEFETYGTHYEVLLRLVSKSGELISPNAFLPTAERFGIMPQLDIWVLNNALKKLADLHRQGQRTHFTVNISGETMEPERLIRTLTSLLDEYHLDASFLTLEITESSAIENLDAAKSLMNELRIRGCHFALDDFGSGFSSFNHLKHLPVDYVKIDGQFVRGMAQDPTDRAIVASINEIAHSFGKQTIAEFVENPEILNQLKKYGVDYAQGYYISPPLRDPTSSKLATIHKIHSLLPS